MEVPTMKLNDLDRKNSAIKALKEHFDINFDTSKLDRAKTRDMLTKVRSLVREAKAQPDFYMNQATPSYMKLVFMEQALSRHFASLKPVRIVVENEEVEKSQVILAAQDMVDAVQKMIEEVNDMLVKELPALVDSIQSEIGVNESGQFQQAASEALTSLNQTLSQSKTGLQTALNSVTGQGNPEAFGAPVGGGDEAAVTDIGTGGDQGVEGEMPPEDMGGELPPEEPAENPGVDVGRAKR